MSEKIKVIIDTDIGSDIDDALCLAYMLSEPRFEILGITTCSSEPWKRAEIADSICRAAGKSIPIFVGRDKPMRVEQKQTAVHQYSVVKSLPHAVYPKENYAIGFMNDMIKKHPGEVVVLAIGPLTNIGVLFSEHPELAAQVRAVATMGGVFSERENLSSTREWNIVNDPHAADIVFKSDAQILIAGLEVTLKTKTSAKDFLRHEHSGIMKTVAMYTQKFTDRTDDMYYHDVIPAAMLVEGDIAKLKRGFVNIDLQNEVGKTKFTESKHGNAFVIYDFDEKRFFEAFKSAISGYST